MEFLKDPRFPSVRERGNSGLRNFQIQKRVTSRGYQGEDKSDEWKRNSNLNSDYSSYRIQVLITKEWARVVPGTGNGN